jgi:hypothetical protein
MYPTHIPKWPRYLMLLGVVLFSSYTASNTVVFKPVSFALVRPGGCSQPRHGRAVCGHVHVRGQGSTGPRVRLAVSVIPIRMTSENQFVEAPRVPDQIADMARTFRPGDAFRVELDGDEPRELLAGCATCERLIIIVEPSDMEIELFIQWNQPPVGSAAFLEAVAD